MICNMCGASYEDSLPQCPYCGAPQGQTAEHTVPVPEEGAASLNAEAAVDLPRTGRPTSKRMALIAAAVGLVIVALLVVLLVVWPNMTQKRFHEELQGTWAIQLGYSDEPYGAKMVIAEEEMDLVFYAGTVELPVGTISYEVVKDGVIRFPEAKTEEPPEFQVEIRDQRGTMRISPAPFGDGTDGDWYREE